MSKPDPASDYPTGAPFSREDWDAVSDNPEWTAEDFARAKPFAETFPDLATKLRRSRGPQKAPVKQLVSLRLDQDVVERFKATGPGWQTRMNEALRLAAGDLPAA